MTKQDIIRFLKENDVKNLTFIRNQYKGLNNNEYHWDKYCTGDLYLFSYSESGKAYLVDNLAEITEKPEEIRYHLLEDMSAWYVEDMDLILFMGTTYKDCEMSDLLTEQGENYWTPDRLFGIFTLDELTKEGITVTIDYRED